MRGQRVCYVKGICSGLIKEMLVLVLEHEVKFFILKFLRWSKMNTLSLNENGNLYRYNKSKFIFIPYT